MDLSKLLTPAAVRVMGQMTSKKRLFQELGELAAQAYGMSGATAIDGLQGAYASPGISMRRNAEPGCFSRQSASTRGVFICLS